MPEPIPFPSQHDAAPPLTVRELPATFKPSESKSHFGWSDEFTYQRIAAGDFRAFKAGRATLVETASVLDYLRANPVKLSRKPRQKAAAA